MRVLLSGHNLDVEVLRELRREVLEPLRERFSPEALEGLSEEQLRRRAAELGERTSALLGRDNWTPETLSAAYARVSRDPRALDELRAIAREEVDRARKSNQTIIFEYGHSSVAEHAAFNFDLIGVSRYAVEAVERHRMCSYTEKSQRYILLEDDFVVPEEVREAGLLEEFVSAIREQNALYHRLYERLRARAFERHPELAAQERNHRMLEGWAKEDARYVASLATEAQVGMTLNARNLEHMIARLASAELSELRELAGHLHRAVEGVAPSLVKYVEPTDYHRLARKELRREAEALFERHTQPSGAPEGFAHPPAEEEDVRLLYATPGADRLLAACLLHSGSGRPMEACRGLAEALSEGELCGLIASTFRHTKGWDAALREFENVDLIFELTVSAGCFGQLKRHRMSTQNVQPYDPDLGCTVPPAVEEVGMRREFEGLMERTNRTYRGIAKRTPPAAPYVLTNAHRRRVLFKCNARELYHVSRLREDPHAQWDIRDKAAKMLRLGRS
ncbi:MAG: FAD-dependent thymidylate synthase, partial [Nitrospinota bacterium]